MQQEWQVVENKKRTRNRTDNPDSNQTLNQTKLVARPIEKLSK